MISVETYQPDIPVPKPTTTSSGGSRWPADIIVQLPSELLTSPSEEQPNDPSCKTTLDSVERSSQERAQSLWSQLQSGGSKLRRLSQQQGETRQHFKDLGRQLAEELSRAKSDLAGKGRDGLWGLYLSSAGIPRSSADRYVRNLRKAAEKKLLTEEPPVLQRDITAVATYFQRKLSRHLASGLGVSELVVKLEEVLTNAESSKTVTSASVPQR